MPLDGRLHDRINRAEEAVCRLPGETSRIPDGTSLLRPVRWWDLYVADEKDPVRVAVQNAGEAEKEL